MKLRASRPHCLCSKCTQFKISTYSKCNPSCFHSSFNLYQLEFNHQSSFNIVYADCTQAAHKHHSNTQRHQRFWEILNKDTRRDWCAFPPCPMCECLSCQCLSVGWDVSQRLALIPGGVHQTPVPRSSDRRSYYFLIALVARVPWERPHHVTDSFVNTASPGVTEWELTAVTPMSRLLSPPFIFLFRLFCVSLLWPGSPFTSSYYLSPDDRGTATTP